MSYCFSVSESFIVLFLTTAKIVYFSFIPNVLKKKYPFLDKISSFLCSLSRFNVSVPYIIYKEAPNHILF